jgi:hypothetical protein
VAGDIDAIADACLPLLNDADKLDELLKQVLPKLEHGARIYVSDHHYRQLSSNISHESVDSSCRGQDLSARPYLQATIPHKGLVLSNSYQDRRSAQSCITLVQAIQQDDKLFGLVIVDFNINELPMPNDIVRMVSNWRQFKGDPAIRDSLFRQKRISSHLDACIDEVHGIIRQLMTGHGVFHFKLHYSSSRVTLWLYDEPHHYRLHTVNDLLSGQVFDSYQAQDYPQDACVDISQLDPVLEQFAALRFADENIYLRSGSVNIINGMVGLNFSCDGSHYIPVQEFIDNSMDYWLGSLQSA